MNNGPQAVPAAHYIQQSPAGCAGGPLHSAIARRLRQRPITFSNRPQAAPAAHYIQQSPAGCASGPLHSMKQRV